MPVQALRHEFVEYVPDQLEDGTIYISVAYATAVHRCCCGCGSEVVTPLSPTDWALTYDGETVSFEPSIGNWSFTCQSHYWIRRGRVLWAARWTPREIAEGRAHSARAKERYVEEQQAGGAAATTAGAPDAPRGLRGLPRAAMGSSARLWARLKRWWR